VTESWLHDSSFTGHLQWSGYSFFSKVRQGKRGGGVCLWCKNQWKPKLIDYKDSEQLSNLIDFIPISFSTDSFNVALILVYIPPSLNDNKDIELLLSDWIDAHIDKDRYPNLIICGDVNRVNLDILKGEYNLHNIIKDSTRGNATLDKVYLSPELMQRYKNVSVVDPIASSDHKAVLISTENKEEVHSTGFVKYNLVYDFRKVDFLFTTRQTDLLSSITSINCNDINQYTSHFYHTINSILNTIPTKVVRRTHNDKPWISDKIKSLINDRWAAFRRKQFPKYNHLKEKIKKEISLAKKNWLTNKWNKSKDLWSVVRFIEGKSTKSRMYCKTQLPALAQIAQDLYFDTNQNTSVSSTLTQKGNHQSISFMDIFQSCLTALGSINIKKSIGADQIPNKFYKVFLPFIINPLSHFVCVILKTSSFPDSLKEAFILPIPKASPSDINNFRPISILNTLARLIEKVIFQYYESTIYNAYGANQFGFRAGSSTSIALIFIFECVKKIMDQNNNDGCLLIAIDLSKAFDNVNHATLIDKLNHHTNLSFTNLIKSYLSNRKARIKIDEMSGPEFIINKGVPQGSCLGPALFCIYISDLRPALPTSTLVKYADDVTLVLPINDDISNSLKIEMDNINKWCSDNRMQINMNKTQALPILKKGKTFNCTEITCTDEILLLGFKFDHHLSFNAHFAKAVKASRNIYLLKTMKYCVPQKALHSIFTAKIRSFVEYGLPSITHISSFALFMIRRLYKRCLRIIDINTSSSTDIEETQKSQKLKLSDFPETIQENYRQPSTLSSSLSATPLFLRPLFDPCLAN